MSALDNTPVNKNFLSPLGFKFLIKKAPHVNFFVQNVNIPTVELPNAVTSNPFVKIPHPGEHINYGSLRVSFKIDEDLENYLEIFRWIEALGKPENFEQYKSIDTKQTVSGDGKYSDISVISLTSAKNAHYEFVYTDAHPTSISVPDNFMTTDIDVNYMSAVAEFSFTNMLINRISS